MVVLTAQAERRLVRDAMVAVSATPTEAEAVADNLLEADLRGHDSHGLARLGTQVNPVRGGRVRVGARPFIEREGTAALVMDADRALGPHAMTIAVGEAVRRAERAGSCALALHNYGYTAYVGRYAELAVERDCVAVLMLKSRTAVHPHGGLRRLIGTNPLTIGIPTEGDPVLVDLATSTSSNGKLQAALRSGRPIPADWAVDERGVPTTDPAAAVRGALSPLGGAKGYALGLAVDVLASILSHGTSTPFAFADGPAEPWGALILALHVPAFMEPREFRRQVSDYLRRIKQSPTAPGFDEILLPGERSYRLRAERLKRGVPMPDAVWRQVTALCGELGLDAAAYLRPAD